TRAFYVIPRLNPDGSEVALAERPRFLRSSVRPWPLPDAQDGLHEEDVDGDGRILFMRVPDPNGAWRAADEDPRLLGPRRARRPAPARAAPPPGDRGRVLPAPPRGDDPQLRRLHDQDAAAARGP